MKKYSVLLLYPLTSEADMYYCHMYYCHVRAATAAEAADAAKQRLIKVYKGQNYSPSELRCLGVWRGHLSMAYSED